MPYLMALLILPGRSLLAAAYRACTCPHGPVTLSFSLAVAGFSLLSAFGLGTAAAQTAEPPQFSLKERHARAGSNIRQDAVRNTGVPLNKRYEELTDEQKGWLHDAYESMGPGDEPPFPAAGLKPIYEVITRAQEKLGARGPLDLVATVAADGSVSEVKVLASPSREMTRVVSSALLLTPFKPASCQGEPCSMDFPLRVQLAVR